MTTEQYLKELNIHFSYLYEFSRQINELDFAASLSGEFRGAQDAGWNTTLTAEEVYNELQSYSGSASRSKADLRIILMLYCQLAEAGGVYETLKNMMGIVTLKPYLLWPFKDLVKVRKKPDRIIGPNANSTFRDLATTAKEIGLSGLSALLESTFRDDIRNGIYHADYVIWNDGLRLRNRNGGYANKIPFDEVSTSVSRAIGFFHILREYNLLSVYSFNPPKTISGRFSANFPMPWTVGFDPESGAFSISGSSPAPVVTPEYKRQEAINGQLGGRVLSVYSRPGSSLDELEMHINRTGFEPNIIEMNDEQFEELLKQVDNLKLWDDRQINSKIATLLVASPWGFRNIHDTLDFDRILPNPLINLTFGDSDRSDS